MDWEDELDLWMNEMLGEFEEPPIKKQKECECGAKKAGVNHAVWCPEWKEFK